MLDDAFLFAFLVTVGAGLATLVGASLALFAKHTNRKFLAVALGFSAGVMIYVSFVEIIPKSIVFLEPSSGEGWASGIMAIAFLGGLSGMALLYRLIPGLEHPALDDAHTSVRLDDEGLMERMDKSLLRAGMGVALAITLHNFP